MIKRFILILCLVFTCSDLFAEPQRVITMGILQGAELAEIHKSSGTPPSYCYAYGNYLVTTVYGGDGPGDGIYIVNRNDKEMRCDMEHPRGRDVAFGTFLGLWNDWIFVDDGTSTGHRALFVYDLKSEKKIYQGGYYSDMETIISIEPSDRIKFLTYRKDISASSECPKSISLPQGDHLTLDEWITVNLKSGKEEASGKFQCVHVE